MYNNQAIEVPLNDLGFHDKKEKPTSIGLNKVRGDKWDFLQGLCSVVVRRILRPI